MRIRFLAILALTFAVAACEAESSTPAAATDSASGADAAGSDTTATDTAATDTTAADTAATDTAATDTAATDTAATDTAATDTAASDTAVVTGAFAPAGAALAAKCGTCHASMPKPKFDGKDCATAAALATKIQANISGGSMPPKGSPALTAEEAAAIAAWVTTGAKCN